MSSYRYNQIDYYEDEDYIDKNKQQKALQMKKMYEKRMSMIHGDRYQANMNNNNNYIYHTNNIGMNSNVQSNKDFNSMRQNIPQQLPQPSIQMHYKDYKDDAANINKLQEMSQTLQELQQRVTSFPDMNSSITKFAEGVEQLISSKLELINNDLVNQIQASITNITNVVNKLSNGLADILNQHFDLQKKVFKLENVINASTAASNDMFQQTSSDIQHIKNTFSQFERSFQESKSSNQSFQQSIQQNLNNQNSIVEQKLSYFDLQFEDMMKTINKINQDHMVVKQFDDIQNSSEYIDQLKNLCVTNTLKINQLESVIEQQSEQINKLISTLSKKFY
jgi:hypothetical protein